MNGRVFFLGHFLCEVGQSDSHLGGSREQLLVAGVLGVRLRKLTNLAWKG
jgi:hypothetical protein